MQYGSIGWSVGATLGMAAGLRGGKKRVLALIGDGSFQMTAQDVATMVKYRLNPIILLLNNDGYTIEVEIHDGPYNNIHPVSHSPPPTPCLPACVPVCVCVCLCVCVLTLGSSSSSHVCVWV